MWTDESVQRPLRDLRVIEFEAIGPGPLAGRMLSDLGAHVTVVARPSTSPVDRALIGENTGNPLRQGKEIITLDLKASNGVITALDLIADADALIEGNRPGVMERSGLGPAECAVRNPRLVYGRMTGWGQSGPLAQAAGHDLNYIALTGLLSLSARSGAAPIVPPTVLGDRDDIDDGSIDDTAAAATASVQHGADHTEAEARCTRRIAGSHRSGH